jgi:heterodisulfide reductase subunit B
MSDNGSKLTLFMGCLIPTKYPQVELATNILLKNLDIPVTQVKGFSCCPDPIYFRARNNYHWLTLAARNLSLAREANADIVALCSGCNSTLRDAVHILGNDGELMKQVNEKLARIGKNYDGKASVKHLIAYLRDDVGAERLEKSVTRKLTGLKAAPFYGCHILKPSEVMQFEKSLRFPRSLDPLIGVTGVGVVHYSEESNCCGKGSIDEEISLSMTEKILAGAKAAGADFVCVVCPYCFAALELGQLALKRKKKLEIGLPVVFYPQLLALAQGATPEDVGLQLHKIKANVITEKLAALSK